MTERPAAPSVPTVEELPRLAACMHESRRERLARNLGLLAGWVAKGAIPNARYQEVRSSLANPLIDAYTEASRRVVEGLDGQADRTRRIRAALDISMLANLGTVDRRLSQLESLGWTGPEGEALANGRALLAEMTRGAAPLAWLAGAVQKRAAPGTAPPAPVLPTATREANELVEGIMRKTMAGLREDLVAQIAGFCEEDAKDTERLCAEIKALLATLRAAYAAKAPQDRGAEGKLRAMRETVAKMEPFAGNLVAYDPNSYETLRRPHPEAGLRRFCEREADAVMAQCIARNVAKLAPVVEAMGGTRITLLNASVSYAGVTTVFDLAFEPAGGFRFSNAVEHAVSPLGNRFARYPARFHDVTGPDGARVKGPSEAVVKALFARDVPEAEPAGSRPPGM